MCVALNQPFFTKSYFPLRDCTCTVFLHRLFKYWKQTQNTQCSFQVSTHPALPSSSSSSSSLNTVPPGLILCGNTAATRGPQPTKSQTAYATGGQSRSPEPRRWTQPTASTPADAAMLPPEQLEPTPSSSFFSMTFQFSWYTSRRQTHSCFPCEEQLQHRPLNWIPA